MGNPAAAVRSPVAVVVHHEDSQRTVLADWLTNAGLGPTSYTSAAEALAALEWGTPPALIVTARHLPGLDGWRFCRLLRSPACFAEAPVPILVVADALADDESRRLTAAAGADAWLGQPLDEAEFGRTVQALLAGAPQPEPLLAVVLSADGPWAERLAARLALDGYTVVTATTLAAALAAGPTPTLAVVCDDLPESPVSAWLASRPDCLTVTIARPDGAEQGRSWAVLGATGCLCQPVAPERVAAECAQARAEQAAVQGQRRLAQQSRQAEECERQYQWFLEDGAAFVSTFLPDGTLTYVNQALAELDGLSAAELTGRRLAEVCSPAELAVIQSSIGGLTPHQPTETHEQQHRAADGSQRRLQWTNRASFDEHGRPLRYQAIGVDITDLRQAEQQQAELVKGLRAVVAAADELIAAPDLSTLCRRAVELARDRLGQERCGLFLLEDDPPVLRAKVGTNLRGETVDEDDWTMPVSPAWADLVTDLHDGGPRWRVERDRPLRYHGEIVGHGDHAVTLVRTGHRGIGLLFNDNLVSGVPLDGIRQEVVAIYGSLLGNIIERKRAETEREHLLVAATAVQDQLMQHNRLYHTLLRVGQVIVHSRNRAELLAGVCRAMVEDGEFLMAWVGDCTPDGWVQPVAAAGHVDGYLDGIRIRFDDSPEGRGPTGTALRTRRSVVCSNTTQDPAFSPWRAAALQRGYLTTSAFPLVWRGDVLGVITVYSGTLGAIGPAEAALLEQVGNDLAFAWQAFVEREAHAEAEQALRESEQALRAAQTIAGLGSYVLDIPSGQWVSSEVLDRVFGIGGAYDRDVAGWLSLVHPADSAMMADHLSREVVAEGRRFDREYRIVRPADRAERWVHGLGRLEFDATGRPVKMRGTIQDITERKLAEQERERLQTELTQAQKMESVGRLAGGVAHDFNNMLSVIIGNVDLALDQVAADEPLHTSLAEIQAAARRSADLTRQLLAFARKQTVAPRVLDLNETVAGMLKMLRRLLSAGVELCWQPGVDVWPVHVDPSQIDQILANLCVNARDAVGDVGTITIGTANHTFTVGGDATPVGLTPGDYVSIEVRDDGCGMDEATLAHLFEPFFTTKGVGAGTGLGLASVYGAVRQNEGGIDVHTAAGAGTVFTVYLPRHVGAAEAAPADAAARLAPRGHETILLVEDEPGVLRMATAILERHGYTVLAAGGPHEAQSLAREHDGDLDLLLTDVVMPVLNGRELAAALLARRPELKCLYMSGYTAEAIAHHGVLEAGVHFIQKPFAASGLLTAVWDALHGR